MTRRRSPKAPSKPAREKRSAAAALRLSEPAWLAIGAVSILALFWACRGALFGVPVADDYDFLYWYRFHPFTFLDSMGAPYYWRPTGRQLYFTLVYPIIFSAPWLLSLLHGLLLVATAWFIYRIARRFLPPGLAVGAAVVPLLAEPARSLIIWPTSAQYVLAMLFSVIAVHEALAARKVTAGLAALAALLSHGASALVLWAFPLIAWFRARSLREALVWTGIAVVVGAIWVGGHIVGRAHGTNFFAGGSIDSTLPARIARAIGWTTTAELGLEDSRPGVAPLIGGAYVALFVLAAIFYAMNGRARQRLARAWPGLAASAAWLVIGVFPLALLFPDWSSWRIGVATLDRKSVV